MQVRDEEQPEDPRRARIVQVAAKLFVNRGYAGVGTREIAAAAKVSKRELYTLFENKAAILAACITERIAAVGTPATLPSVSDAASFARVLRLFGASTVRELCRPSTMAVYRLAVVELKTAPEIAEALDSAGRLALRRILRDFFAGAQTAGLLGAGDPDALGEQFFSLLLGERRLRILLGTAPTPTEQEIERRAASATDAFVRLHPV
jgi:AcrR family transcriptional regulator